MVNDLVEQLPEFLKNPNPEIYLSNNYVVLDFETTNKDHGNPYDKENSIVMAGWVAGKDHPNYKRSKVNIRRANEYQLGELVNDIELADFFVAHNTKFEIGWLKRCGLDISKSLPYCTQIGEYVIAGNRSWPLSLNACLKRRKMPTKEDTVTKLLKAGVCPSTMPSRWLAEYLETDVVSAHELFLHQRKKLYLEGLLPTALTRNLFTPPLVEIEQTGMHLDAERVEEVYRYYVARQNELQAEMDEITGGINTGSTKQLREFLYETLKFTPPKDHRGNPMTTPGGELATNAQAIAKLKPKNRAQKKFLEVYTELNKITQSLSKSIGKFQQCVEETKDHILTAEMNQTVTGTHRLSSKGRNFNAQFQNFDRRFKPLFSARNEGWLVGECDEGQLEYRVAVYLGQDEAGMYDITYGVDSHGFTASIIFKEEWEECGGDKNSPLGKKVRTAAKAHTFKPLKVAA